MKWNEKAASILISIAGISLFTVLLGEGMIGSAPYVTLVLALLVASIAIATLPRLLELNLREMKIVLAELKKTKEEIETMYGVIDHLKRQPVAIHKVKYEELGLFGGGIIASHSVVK